MLPMGSWWIRVGVTALAGTACSAAADRAATDACARGEASFLARQYERAQESLWRCVLGGAPAPLAAHRLALTYRETKAYEAGLSRAETALAKSGKSLDLLYLAAFLHFRMRQQQTSIALLGDAYRMNPSDWRVHQLFALNYVVLGIKDGAFAEFQAALALNPRNAELHYQLARFYQSEGRIAESIEESRKTLALFPDYPDVYENLGLCYEALADGRQASENFERAIEQTERLGQKNEWPFVNYAEFLLRQDDAAGAARVLGRALAGNPASAKAHYFMGRAMRKLDRNAESRRYLERAIQLDAADPAPYFELGMLLTRMGDSASAKPMFDRFQELRKAAPAPPAQ
jgi:tetratricopeptide (TPR) repeat protein